MNIRTMRQAYQLAALEQRRVETAFPDQISAEKAYERNYDALKAGDKATADFWYAEYLRLSAPYREALIRVSEGKGW